MSTRFARAARLRSVAEIRQVVLKRWASSSTPRHRAVSSSGSAALLATGAIEALSNCDNRRRRLDRVVVTQSTMRERSRAERSAPMGR